MESPRIEKSENGENVENVELIGIKIEGNYIVYTFLFIYFIKGLNVRADSGINLF